MVVTPELRAQILRLYLAEHWRVGTIARQLHLHRDTVRRVLAISSVLRALPSEPPRLIDPFVPFIRETLAKFPTLAASRLYAMVQERGYGGGSSHFRHLVAPLRPRPAAEAYLRLRTLPAEQAQVDWAHMGHVVVGRARRPLMAFVMVLSYSRRKRPHETDQGTALFGRPTKWTPAQASAVLEVLDEIREWIWLSYGSQIQQELRRNRVVTTSAVPPNLGDEDVPF